MYQLSPQNRLTTLQQSVFPFLEQLFSSLSTIDEQFAERRFRLSFAAPVVNHTDKEVKKVVMLDELEELTTALGNTTFDSYYQSISNYRQYLDGNTHQKLIYEAVLAIPTSYDLRLDWNLRPILKKSDQQGSYQYQLQLDFPLEATYWSIKTSQKGGHYDLDYDTLELALAAPIAQAILEDYQTFAAAQ